jgi:KDO2-lipid IV(A) lauroyltransferase
MPRKLHVHNWRDTVRHLDVHTDPRLFLCDRPILVVTGHFGNWELMCYVFGLIGLRTHAIARPIDNPYLERFVRRFRERTGQKILAKKGDFDRMQELLAKGAILGIVGDQDAGPRGLFVDFFGRPASTHKAIALMALEFRAPLVVLGTPRVAEPASYHILVEDWIEPSEYDGRPDAVSAITQRFTSALERLVRRFPEQYFWLHRRWKHQPQPRRHKKAA